MVKAGFPSGALISAHMLPFKHLKARLGLLCLTACLPFSLIFEEVFAWKGSAPFIVELKICQRTTHQLHLFSSLPAFLCMILLIGMGIFSYLSTSSSSSLYLALPKLAKLESPAVLTNLHFLKACGLPKYYLHCV